MSTGSARRESVTTAAGGEGAAGLDVPSAVLTLVRRHGWNATSFQVLERGFAYWFDPKADACVAYVDTGSAWVAAGAPLAARDELGPCAARFVASAASAGRRACFFAVEDVLVGAAQLDSMPIGEQPSWDPGSWAATVDSSRGIREQLRRARAKGVTTREVSQAELADPTSPARRLAAALVTTWIASRRMAPMGFLLDVQLFHFVEERRFFLAESGGAAVGLLVAVPVFTRGGWLFEDLLRAPAAPNGTTELLIDAAMRAVARDGSRYVTLGLAPLSGEVPPWLRFVREYSRSLYDFDGVRRFKAKLLPEAWMPIYLAWPRGESGNVALLDALAAFTMRPREGHARASFVRFGLETLAHAPALSVRVLAVALVPWIALLALAPSARFFPSTAVHVAWVIWDLALMGAMLALASKWRIALARALAVATSLDALLTFVQVQMYAAPRARNALEVIAIVVACTGPLLATSLLWGALAWRGRRGARLDPMA
jgi:hypothetical protein